MNHFERLPSEIYKEILFVINPKDIMHACNINQYASSICNDKFYQQYIQRNFDPKKFGLEEFVLPLHLNWKIFLDILVNGVKFPVNIILESDRSSVSKTTANIRLDDTLQDIQKTLEKMLTDKYPNMRLYNLKLISASRGKKVLFINGSIHFELTDGRTNASRAHKDNTHFSKMWPYEFFNCRLMKIYLNIIEKHINHQV
jgi:hypothetical protein